MKYQLENNHPYPVLVMEGSLMVETDSRDLVIYVEKNIIPTTNKFIINLEKLSFVNSSGLGALITILTKSRKAGGEVVIVHLNDQIKKLLAITKLTSVFAVASNVQEAEKMLSH